MEDDLAYSQWGVECYLWKSDPISSTQRVPGPHSYFTGCIVVLQHPKERKEAGPGQTKSTDWRRRLFSFMMKVKDQNTTERLLHLHLEKVHRTHVRDNTIRHCLMQHHLLLQRQATELRRTREHIWMTLTFAREHLIKPLLIGRMCCSRISLESILLLSALWNLLQILDSCP